MRKFMTLFTMILVLLSSGAAQMAYHICEEDGAHIWVDDCHTATEDSEKPSNNCCGDTNESFSLNDICCKEAYFFSLSPLPVSPVKFKFEKMIQWHLRAWNHTEYQSHTPYMRNLALPSQLAQHSSKPPNNPSQPGLCIWII